VKCPKCQTENPDSKKFCRNCGNRLALLCPHCSSEYLAGDEFCGECGQKLAEPLDPSRPFSYTPKHLADKILTNRIVQDYADSTLQLATEARLPYYRAIAMFELGWLKMQKGQVEEGIDQIQQGLAAIESMGIRFGIPGYLSYVAEGYGWLGQAERGISLTEESLSFVEKTGERIWEPDLHRVKGELLQSSGRPSDAEASFRKAIEVARRQQARSLELRATLSLARLLHKQGRSKEARQLLSKIYGWFAEGFDTPDLKDAKALLVALEASP